MASPSRDDVPQPATRGLAGAVAALPEAFLVVVAAAAAIGVVATGAGQRPFASVGACLFALAVLVVLAVVVVAGRARGRRAAEDGLLPALPALVLLGFAVAVRFLSPGARAEWFLGGDHVRHLLFVVEEQTAGTLDYAAQPYPRAWHTLVTIIWTATGGRVDASGLRSLVDLLSTAAWFLPAVLSLATGSLTVAVARRYGVARRPAQVAGLTAAAAILLPPFLGNYQALGFENSYVGAIVLAVAAREVVDGQPGSMRPVLVTLTGLVVCAHSWQLLIPGAGVAFLWVAWPVLRRGSAVTRAQLAVATLVATVVSLPALLAVFTVIGVQHATDSQVKAPLPIGLLAVGLVASVVVAVRRRRDRAQTVLLGLVLLPGVTALYLVVSVGVPLTDYYPSKLLWHTAVLGLTPLAVLLVRGWVAAGERRQSVGLRAVKGAAVVVSVLALVYAFISPAAAFLGAWSSTRGPLLLDAITSPGAGGAQVVWLGTKGDDTIGRVLLDFYRISQPRTPQPPLDVAGDCELLRAASHPAVLTDRPEAATRARYVCVPGLTVVPVLGGLGRR